MPLVFFYGTLQRNGANHGVLQRLNATFHGEAQTQDRFTLIDLGPYPALLSPTATKKSALPTTQITGELWQVDTEALQDLDDFEGCPDLYTREEIRVIVLDGSKREGLSAFTYVMTAIDPPRSAKVIPDGRYKSGGMELPTGASRTQFDPIKSTRT